MRDLDRVKGFLCCGRSETGSFNCRRLPAPSDFFSLLLPFACLHFLPLFVFFQSDFIVFLSLIFSVCNSLLLTTFLFSHSMNFSCVYFSHCPLFPSLIVPLYFPPFLCQSFWMFLVASMSLLSYAPCY